MSDDEEHIIVIKDDGVYGYIDVIDKMMHRKSPFIDRIVRRKEFKLGTYRIRNGLTKRITQDEIEIIQVKKIMWIKLTNDEAREILGIDHDEQLLKDYHGYLIALRKYWSRHDMSFMNHPYMYDHFIRPIPKPIQQKLL
jgi:hypothetical protein